MDGAFKSIAQHAGEILALLIVAVGFLVYWSLRQKAAMRSMRSVWNAMFEGARGEQVERMLLEHLKERLELEKKVAVLEGRISELEGRMESAKRHLGAIRYDAFDDVGGAQSFALALFDDRGDGFVLNGITGRADSRIYCKSLVGGRSERNLSQEEQRAIKDAMTGGQKTVTTP